MMKQDNKWGKFVSLYGNELFKVIRNARILIVGAGGIGCELLKNLVLSGFTKMEVVDFDTIEISNLNRQFLFRKHHRGMSKSLVACESIKLYLDPKLEYEIHAEFDSIKSCRYTTEHIKKFDIVLNALDNLSARRHVNRLCLSSNVPLVDGGSNGWLGQAQPFIPNLTGCFECYPKPIQKQFPICTIRNNPTEPIHTVVWAKYLFESLFRSENNERSKFVGTDQSVDTSTSSHDSEFSDERDSNTSTKKIKSFVDTACGISVFDKVFGLDIVELNSYYKNTENTPEPMYYSKIIETDKNNFNNVDSQKSSDNSSANDATIADQRIWSLRECAQTFISTFNALNAEFMQSMLTEHGFEWDKENDVHVEFVTSASNLRSIQFKISTQSKFKVKSDAGNIIASIATTNSIISGAIVLEAIKILKKDFVNVKQSFLLRNPSRKFGPLVTLSTEGKSEKCYACSNKFLSLQTNTQTVLFQDFVSHFIREQLNVCEPIILLENNIIYEFDNKDSNQMLKKTLHSIGVTDNVTLIIEDFATDLKFSLSIQNKNLDQFSDPSKPFIINS